MKNVRALFATAALAFATSPAMSQAVPFVGGLTNSRLKARSITGLTAGATITRTGFTTVGDSPPVTYVFSTSPCSLNAGAGDNGSQVKPNIGAGCWNAALKGAKLDPRIWGAKSDGATDDTAAIQEYINWVQANGAGEVDLGRGYYCIKTGPIRTNVASVTIRGQNRYGATTLDACGSDVVVVRMDGFRNQLQTVQVIGANNVSTGNSAIVLSANCSECAVDDVFVTKGWAGIDIDSYEAYVKWSRIEYFYGAAGIRWKNTGGNAHRVKIDPAYPAGTPTRYLFSPGSTVPARANNAAYVATQSLVVVSGFILQAMNSGTSGATTPTVLPYGQDIVDGSVKWRLVGQDSNSGILFETGSGIDAVVDLSDFSAATAWAIKFSNGSNGQPPRNIAIDNNTIASELYGGIQINSGSGIQITNNRFGGCVANQCNGVQIGSSAVGDIQLSGNQFVGYGTGVYIGGGKHIHLANELFGLTVQPVSVAANVTNFSIRGSDFCGSAVYGANTGSIYIAPGTSNYYTVTNNCLSTPGGLQDYGTGTAKSLTGNF